MEQTVYDLIDMVKQVFPDFSTGVSFDEETHMGVKRCINNAKVSDHHAIIPTAQIENTDLNALPDGEKNILFMIAGKLLTATSEPHKYETVKVIVKCENNDFYVSGKTVIEDGFKSVEQYIKSVINGKSSKADGKKENKLPEITEEQEFENVSADVTSGFTTPPNSYTEDTLLGAMETAGNTDYDENSDVEKKGLGTPATRDSIIEHLIKHGYIVRDKKKITATEKGVNFIGILPDEIKSAKLTVDWETALQNIEKGEISPESFMSEIENFTKELVEKYSEKAENSPFAKKKEILGKCPRCGKNIYEGKQNYYCESGKEGCGFTVWKELKYPNTSVSPEQLKALLNEGKARFEAISKEGKKYTADFALEDTGKYINLVFLPAESEDLGKCPKCGESVLSGKYGFYCKGKCGMNIGKVYGKELTEIQVKKLLEGKQITLVSSGSKTVVMPEVVRNDYNGKTYFQWKTKRR